MVSGSISISPKALSLGMILGRMVLRRFSHGTHGKLRMAQIFSSGSRSGEP